MIDLNNGPGYSRSKVETSKKIFLNGVNKYYYFFQISNWDFYSLFLQPLGKF